MAFIWIWRLVYFLKKSMDEIIQINEINKNNAELVFSPHFIPFYPDLIKKWLKINEALVFWFIKFYLNEPNKKFYFTNKQIWDLFWFWEVVVSRLIQKLRSKWLIKANYVTKSNWWKIRYLQIVQTDLYNCISQTYTKSTIKRNNIKINKKEINKEKNSQTLKNLIEEMIKDKSYLLKIKWDLQINDKTIKEQLEWFVEYWKEKDAKWNERWSREKFFSTKRRFRTRLDRWLNYWTIKQTEEKQKTPEELKKMEEIAKLFTS